jgi:hypothetical protein
LYYRSISDFVLTQATETWTITRGRSYRIYAHEHYQVHLLESLPKFWPLKSWIKQLDIECLVLCSTHQLPVWSMFCYSQRSLCNSWKDVQSLVQMLWFLSKSFYQWFPPNSGMTLPSPLTYQRALLAQSSEPCCIILKGQHERINWITNSPPGCHYFLKDNKCTWSSKLHFHK